MGCFPPNLSLRVDSLNSGRHTKDWCCHGSIGPPPTARRRMVAPGDLPVGPTGPPEVYPRLGPERTARGDFSSIGPVSRFSVPLLILLARSPGRPISLRACEGNPISRLSADG